MIVKTSAIYKTLTYEEAKPVRKLLRQLRSSHRFRGCESRSWSLELSSRYVQ